MNATCPRCHGPLREGESPQGLCPKCLLAVAMGESQVVYTATGERAPEPPSPEELAPHFPGLRIESIVGRGGMGVVYRAHQEGLDRPVALKVLHANLVRDPAFEERFRREARAMAAMAHPNVATVYDSGQAGPWFYLLMELVDGPNLRQVIRGGELQSADALAIVSQVCEALDYAHGEGVVHRDIKPENILLDRRGRVKIVDFGLAKLVLGGLDPGLTGTHQAMGTWHYMAPEQVRRPLEVDHRADIYSLGVVFYELLTGDLPLGRFPAPSQTARGLSPTGRVDARLDEVVFRTLEQDPDRRYQHASAVQHDVERIASGPAVADAVGAAAGAGARGMDDRAAGDRHGRSRGDRLPSGTGEGSGRGDRGRKNTGTVVAIGCLVLVLGLPMLVGVLFLFWSAAPSVSYPSWDTRPVEVLPGPSAPRPERASIPAPADTSRPTEPSDPATRPPRDVGWDDLTALLAAVARLAEEAAPAGGLVGLQEPDPDLSELLRFLSGHWAFAARGGVHRGTDLPGVFEWVACPSATGPGRPLLELAEHEAVGSPRAELAHALDALDWLPTEPRPRVVALRRDGEAVELVDSWSPGERVRAATPAELPVRYRVLLPLLPSEEELANGLAGAVPPVWEGSPMPLVGPTTPSTLRVELDRLLGRYRDAIARNLRRKEGPEDGRWRGELLAFPEERRVLEAELADWIERLRVTWRQAVPHAPWAGRPAPDLAHELLRLGLGSTSIECWLEDDVDGRQDVPHARIGGRTLRLPARPETRVGEAALSFDERWFVDGTFVLDHSRR